MCGIGSVGCRAPPAFGVSMTFVTPDGAGDMPTADLEGGGIVEGALGVSRTSATGVEDLLRTSRRRQACPQGPAHIQVGMIGAWVYLG